MKNTQIKYCLNLSKINYIIRRLDTCNLQTKIVLYPDKAKLLKQVDGS